MDLLAPTTRASQHHDMAPEKGISKTDPPWKHVKLSSDDLQCLKTQWSVLHLLHHRSHNQHRRSTWYRHFNTFRKQLRSLIDDLDPQIPPEALPSRKVRTFQPALQRVEKRIKFWAEVMVEKWYAAFMQLIGDQQFAVLGVTIFAVLAKVVDVLGILEKMQDEASLETIKDDLHKAAERQRQPGNDYTNDIALHDVGVAIERAPASEDEAADIGIAVDRDEIKKTTSRRVAGDGKLIDDSKAMPSDAKAPKKKRKRNADEIDDLFSGLLGD